MKRKSEKNRLKCSNPVLTSHPLQGLGVSFHPLQELVAVFIFERKLR
jgi:hypothetical protein